MADKANENDAPEDDKATEKDVHSDWDGRDPDDTSMTSGPMSGTLDTGNDAAPVRVPADPDEEARGIVQNPYAHVFENAPEGLSPEDAYDEARGVDLEEKHAEEQGEVVHEDDEEVEDDEESESDDESEDDEESESDQTNDKQ